MPDGIITDGALNEAHLRMLVDKINNRFGKEREAISKNTAERQFQNASRHL